MKISVIVPAYNAALTLPRCLDSLLAQQMTDYEIICVNDGSTDGTAAVLSAYQENHPQSIIVITQENTGVWYARLSGLSVARGTYCAFCDSDDTVSPVWLPTLLSNIEQYDADMAVCAYQRIAEQSQRILSTEMTCEGCFDVSKDKTSLIILNSALWNKLIRTDCIKPSEMKLQPPRVAEDAVFLTLVYTNVNRFVMTPHPLYMYAVSEQSAMKAIQLDDCIAVERAFGAVASLTAQALPINKRLVACNTFVHCAVAIPILMIETGDGKPRQIASRAKQYLENYFPEWRRLLTLRQVQGSPFRGKLLKIYAALVCYRLGLFGMALCVYRVLCKVIKLRW